jgi:hypothetical protein
MFRRSQKKKTQPVFVTRFPEVQPTSCSKEFVSSVDSQCVGFQIGVYNRRKWYLGYAVAQLVEVLLYKLEGCGFDSQWDI